MLCNGISNARNRPRKCAISEHDVRELQQQARSNVTLDFRPPSRAGCCVFFYRDYFGRSNGVRVAAIRNSQYWFNVFIIYY
jgi:hypothetical protein